MFLFKPLFIRFRHGDLEGYFVRNDLEIFRFGIRMLSSRIFIDRARCPISAQNLVQQHQYSRWLRYQSIEIWLFPVLDR